MSVELGSKKHTKDYNEFKTFEEELNTISIILNNYIK